MYRTALTAAAILLTGAAISAPAYAAPVMADSSIDLAGYFQANGGTSLATATSLDFVTGPGGTASPGVPGTATSYGSGTGTFSSFTCSGSAGCGSIIDLSSLSVGAQSITNFLSLTGGNNTAAINFDLTGITEIIRSSSRFLSFTATGNLRYDGFDSTPATFLFSSQGNTATSFSATVLASPVPEPAMWGMTILGFGMAGVALRRRRTVSVTYA